MSNLKKLLAKRSIDWQEMVIPQDKLFSRDNPKISMPDWDTAGSNSD
jgi:hypothetical protein